MKFRNLVLAAALAVAAGHAQAQNFSDTSMGLREGFFVANPGGGKGSRNVVKSIVNLGHFDVWDYGSNFFSGDILFSNANEPAANSSGGSTEFYGVWRSQLSPDKIVGINTAFGPFSAVNFEIGGDANTENSAFGPNKKLLVAGPNFHVNMPAGFFDIGVHIAKEWTHNGFSSCPSSCGKGGPIDFDPTAEFEFVWLYPLAFTGLPLDIRGFMNIVLPKGTDGFGSHTYTEILARPQLQLDVGTMLFNRPHKPDIFLAVEFWHHKFGNPSEVSGSDQVAPLIGIEYHF